MSLKSKIEIDYQSSLKSKDKSKISTYRLILSSIKDLEFAKISTLNELDIFFKKVRFDNFLFDRQMKTITNKFIYEYVEAKFEFLSTKYTSQRIVMALNII